MADDPAPVIRISEPHPGDAEVSQAVMDAVLPLLPPLVDAVGQLAVLDGLASVYVSLAVYWLGEAVARDALRRYGEAIPRIAAVQRARAGKAGGGRA
jgi:hypothetical protein